MWDGNVGWCGVSFSSFVEEKSDPKVLRGGGGVVCLRGAVARYYQKTAVATKRLLLVSFNGYP